MIHNCLILFVAFLCSAADEAAGEIPVAFVMKRPGSSLSRDEVIEHVAKEVSICLELWFPL